MAVIRVAALFILLAIPAVYAAEHVVGGSGGTWSTAGGYDDWAKKETFNVGDTLVFNYDSSHGVAVVSKDGYENCDTSNAKTFNNGKTTITLSKAGTMYFICPTMFHCSGGMKLAVNVEGSSPPSGGSAPTTPATPSNPTTPSTPSGSNTPSNTPSTSTPGAGSSPDGQNGAASGHGSINHLIIGFSLVLAALNVHV